MNWLLFASLLVAPQEWHFEVTEPSIFSVEVVSPPAEPDLRGYYVLMFTADYCAPCHEWKLAGNPAKMKAAGYPVTMVDMGKPNRWTARVRSIPTFWIVDRETKQPVWEHTGPVSTSVILNKINSLPDSEKAAETVVNTLFRNPSIYGLKGTSHESRATLINHLANDGIHSGRHSWDTLNAMSDDQLNELHKQDHGWK